MFSVLNILNNQLGFHFQKIVLIIVFCPYWTYEEELCGALNGKISYLQLGEFGNITHKQEISDIGNNSVCGVELVTCPFCIINITFGHFDLPDDCNASNKKQEVCDCNLLKIWEPIEPNASTRKLCYFPRVQFVSLTRSVRILMNSYKNQSSSFILYFRALRNQKIIKGFIGDSGEFNSPYFPAIYPQDIGMEHVFSCSSEDCRVRIEFSDYLLASASILEFFDWNGKRIYVISGSTFRPPIVTSSGPSLAVKFYGNGANSYGYNGHYVFVNLTDIFNTSNTECGGEVTDVGGVIMMTHLNDFYDCYWIIKPINMLPTIKTHLYLKIIEFSVEGILQVTSGIVSKAETLEYVNTDVLHGEDIIFKEHVVALNSGLYVAIKGTFNIGSRVSIVYTLFNYMDCVLGSDLMCDNKRCIALQLSCDGFDNCGDNSDEPPDCSFDPVPREYQRYYFPKAQVYQDIRAATQLFIISCIVLMVIVFGLMVALCQLGIRARNGIEFTAHVRTISELLSANQSEESDDPPVYEPPPEYSQAIKTSQTSSKQISHRIQLNSLSSKPLETRTGWKYAKGECLQCHVNKTQDSTASTSMDAHSFSLKITAFNERKPGFSLALPSVENSSVENHEMPTVSEMRSNIQKQNIKRIPASLNDTISSDLLFDLFQLKQGSRNLTPLTRSASYEKTLWYPKETKPYQNSRAAITPLPEIVTRKFLIHFPVKSTYFHKNVNQTNENVSLPMSKSYPGGKMEYFFGEV